MKPTLLVFVLSESDQKSKTLKMLAPFLSASFREKFRFVKVKDLNSAFSHEHGGTPALFGGSLILNYEKCFERLQQALPSLRDNSYFMSFSWTCCEKCASVCKRIRQCSECDRNLCGSCVDVVDASKSGVTHKRSICASCLEQLRGILQNSEVNNKYKIESL